MILNHCPSNCHTDALQSYVGAGGSFTTPDHEYPAGGFALVLNGSQLLPTPFTRTVIQGSQNTISAPSPQTKAKKSWSFSSWSDRGAQSHNVIVNYSATYKQR